MIIADTNLIAYLVVPGEHTQAAEDALRSDAEWVAPSSWRIELLNVLSTYCRHAPRQGTRVLTVDEACEAYVRARRIVRDIPFEPAALQVLELSVRSGVSGYDCVFVAAAQMNRLPLVTFDQQLLRAFPETAILPGSIERWFEMHRGRE